MAGGISEPRLALNRMLIGEAGRRSGGHDCMPGGADPHFLQKSRENRRRVTPGYGFYFLHLLNVQKLI